jgi:hypothetical protein
MARKAHRRTKKQLNDNDGDDDDDDDKTDYDSGTTSNNTTDDEYFALIAGDDEDDDEDDDEAAEVEAPWMKRVREAFESADENADGALSLMEARNLFVAATAGAQLLTGAVGDRNDVTTETRRLDVLEAKMDRIIQLLEEQQQQRIL